MAAITSFQPGGYPGRLYGTFTHASTSSAAISGTITQFRTAADIWASGLTIIIALSNDIWAPAGAAFDAVRQGIIFGLDSAQSEAAGWDAVVLPGLPVTAVVRTSDTVVTITLPAFLTYYITAADVVTVTVPATALTVSLVDLVGSPTFTIQPAGAPPSTDAHTGGKGDNPRYTVKPLGLPAKRKTVNKRVEEAREIHAEVSKRAQEQFGLVSERETKTSLAPVSEMLPEQIDAEIAYWLKLKQSEDSEIILLLLMAGSVN